MNVIAKASGFGMNYLLLQDKEGKYYKIYADEFSNIMELNVPKIDIEEFDKYFN